MYMLCADLMVIGKGGRAVVDLVVDPKTEQFLAMKTTKTTSMLREIAILKTLEKEPSVPTLHHHNPEGTWFVMSVAPGKELFCELY